MASSIIAFWMGLETVLQQRQQATVTAAEWQMVRPQPFLEICISMVLYANSFHLLLLLLFFPFALLGNVGANGHITKQSWLYSSTYIKFHNGHQKGSLILIKANVI